MGYAVELYFDPGSESAVRRIWSGIADEFGLSAMSDKRCKASCLSRRVFRRCRPSQLPPKAARVCQVTGPIRVPIGQCRDISDCRGCGIPGPCSDERVARLPRAVSHSLFQVWRLLLNLLPARQLGTALHRCHRSHGHRDW